MHKLEEKRGKRKVTHHFSHVTEKDGSKKHVYLGTDPKQATERLTKLQVERMRSNNRLIKDMDDVQKRLERLGHHNRPYDSVVDDLRLRYHKQRQAEKMLSQGAKENFPLSTYILVIAAVLILGVSFYYMLSDPAVTGAAVGGVTKLATNHAISAVSGMLVVIAILGLVLHAAEHRHRHRHDRFKRPE
ncbi:hypothetical protein JW898_05995 [Candidatus Woesearchaeota archaeon]|nr:hypothetical protein [Candidatus Woesearchaeota archaeon]